MSWRFFKKKSAFYPADRYSKEYIEERLKVTGKYELSKIPPIFELLLTSSNELKIRTAKVLQEYVLSLNILVLSKLDRIFRNHTSLDWKHDWKNESPENLLMSDMTEAERIIILGLCSFHPNGYFREKALHLLNLHDSGYEFPYLLIRCNDWVSEIRESAKKNVECRLTTKYVNHIVNNLPIVFKLKNTRRNDHSQMFEHVAHLLSQKESFPYLDQGTRSKSIKVRYFCYQMIVHSKLYKKELLFNYLKLEKEPHPRLLLFNELISDISVIEFNEYYPILKKDKFPMIRARVLEKYHFFFPNESICELESALVDKSYMIRSLVRFLLKKHNFTDFSSFYMQMINSKQSLRGAILGLGEVGKKDHAKEIIPFLAHNDVSIVKAAILALAILDGKSYKGEFVWMLNHRHVGVSNAARRSLKTLNYSDLKEQLYTIYKKTRYNHSKYNIALLLCSLAKWDAIIYIIEFYVNREDSNLTGLGRAYFDKWIENFNRTFDSPTMIQIESIKNTLAMYGSRLEKQDVRYIEFSITGFQ